MSKGETSIQEPQANSVNLGDLISLFYEEYLELYGDEELAAVAAAATINELLRDEPVDEKPEA